MRHEEIYQKAYSSNKYFKELMDRNSLNSISIVDIVDLLNVKNAMKKKDEDTVKEIDICFFYLDLYLNTDTWYNIYKDSLSKIKVEERKNKLKKLK